MKDVHDWWQRPRRVAVLVDNPSWILPYAERLVSLLEANGDRARLCRSHDELEGDVAFYLGCIRITPRAVRERMRRNLVVHASDLPKGRGFSPWTWQILEGKNEIPICLLEAVDEVDAGPVIYRDRIRFAGHELIDELRAAIGQATIDLCQRFMMEAVPLEGTPQRGEATIYRRRRPDDSRLDPNLSLAQQFDLLRTVDNNRYPAFFELRGHRYIVKIEKQGPIGGRP